MKCQHIILAAVLALCASIAWPAHAQDQNDPSQRNIVEWDATSDPRVQGTEIERCFGSTIECAAAGANWDPQPRVPVPATQFIDFGVQEGRSYSYRGRFYNTAGEGPYSPIAGRTVPFGGPPASAPANWRTF